MLLNNVHIMHFMEPTFILIFFVGGPNIWRLVCVMVVHSPEQASFDFMKVNASKFDSHNLKEARNEVCGLPRGAGLSSSKVMTGGRGVKVQLSDATKEVLRAKWESVVQPETGHACYQDLREAMRQEMQNAFVVGNEE